MLPGHDRAVFALPLKSPKIYAYAFLIEKILI
jgi:hypothetical protein